jgi:serine/threonine-protein kinase HipA
MSSRTLAVVMSGQVIAYLQDAGMGYAGLTYAPEIVDSHLGQPLLSVSLPVRSELYPGVQTRPFWEGLLPEGAVRQRLCERLRLPLTDTFGLLEAIGADCAGAISTVPPEQVDAFTGAVRGDVEWLGSAELEKELVELPLRPLGADPEQGVRISLAGAQDKLVLVRSQDGRYGRPKGPTPSTHILKPEHRDYHDTIANEAYCLRVARYAGIEAAEAQTEQAGEARFLVIARFDRRTGDDGRIQRLHQEDACQALRLMPDRKYEESGGPSARTIVELLRRFSLDAAHDVPALLERLVLAVLTGNCDMHGKNIAFLHGHGGIRLAPAYDLLSTIVYPGVSRHLAMRIGGCLEIDELGPDDWRAELKACRLGTRAMERRLHATGQRVLAAMDQARDDAAREGFESPLLDRIMMEARRRAESLRALA